MERSKDEGGLRMHTHVQIPGLVLGLNTHKHAHTLTHTCACSHTSQHAQICMHMYIYACTHHYKYSLMHTTRCDHMRAWGRISHEEMRRDLQGKWGKEASGSSALGA